MTTNPTRPQNHTPSYCGIDIAKAKIDVDDITSDQVVTHPNTPAGCRKALRSLLARHGEGLHLVIEATGGYERTLIAVAEKLGVPVCLTNPLQVRDYARGRGLLHKTDKVDTKVLSAFGKDNHPRVLAVQSPARKRLAALSGRRAQLVKMIIAEEARLEKEHDKEIRADIRDLLGMLNTRLGGFDQRIAEVIKEDASLYALGKRLAAIKGVGQVTVAALITGLPELGKIEDKPLKALVGVAPMNRDSGQMRGRRTIMRGRSGVRRSLYMAAWTASQHNAILKEFYQRLRSNGKGHKQALIAVIGKLLTLANRIARDPDFQPQNG